MVPALAALVRKPILGAVAARLAGSPAIRLWHDQLLFKPVEQPGQRANVGRHTGKGYWQTCTSAGMLTAWIPFHACGEEMGSITMVDGSNHWPDDSGKLDFFSHDLGGLEHRCDTGGAAIRKVVMGWKKGEVSFHHSFTIHGSGPNLGDKPRRSVAVHLQDDFNYYHPRMLPDGTPARHHNDDLCRRRPDGRPDSTDPLICPTLYPPTSGNLL